MCCTGISHASRRMSCRVLEVTTRDAMVEAACRLMSQFCTETEVGKDMDAGELVLIGWYGGGGDMTRFSSTHLQINHLQARVLAQSLCKRPNTLQVL